MQEHTLNKAPHNLILQDRKELSLSGVLEVISFDEDNVVVKTTMGELTVNGENLHITKTNVETGELLLDGHIQECIYTDISKNNKSDGIFKKLFNKE